MVLSSYWSKKSLEFSYSSILFYLFYLSIFYFTYVLILTIVTLIAIVMRFVNIYLY